MNLGEKSHKHSVHCNGLQRGFVTVFKIIIINIFEILLKSNINPFIHSTTLYLMMVDKSPAHYRQDCHDVIKQIFESELIKPLQHNHSSIRQKQFIFSKLMVSCHFQEKSIESKAYPHYSSEMTPWHLCTHVIGSKARMSSWTNSPVIYLFLSKHVCVTECLTYLIQEPVQLFFIIPVEVLALTGLSKKVSVFTVLLEI